MGTRERIACFVLLCIAAVGCGDEDDFEHDDAQVSPLDAGTLPPPPPVYVSEPGVCELAECPQPFLGIACCTPLAQCGTDFLGLGLSCLANPGEPIDAVCDLMECPDPPIGVSCCTPVGRCGTDLYGTGVMCYPNAPALPGRDGGTICPLDECPIPTQGYACCTIDARCGVDLYGFGQCVPNLETPDAGPISTGPPDDPSVTGECPSYLGLFGPVWGCCSPYGVCGTFQFGACLLPIGAPLPISIGDDAGDPSLCIPPE